MSTINQFRALLPPDDMLTPPPSLIDGRTEQDRLGFLCDYATLINFYDSDNAIKGNWAPFLLKDPVFLLASISKTKFSVYRYRFSGICRKLDQLLAKEDSEPVDSGAAFNLLFDFFTGIFIKIKQWLYFMQLADDDYTLKTYVIHQIKTNYGKYFWATVSLRQNLYMSAMVPGVKPVDHGQFYYFDAYEEQLWKQNKDKTPYLDVMNLKRPLKANSPVDIFNSLKNAGDELLRFFNTIIQHAGSEFENVKAMPGRYPDTLLLRAFTELMRTHQDQLNGLTKKHLDFYYREILKQSEKPAELDTALICAELAKTDSTFTLPAGTVFNAGADAQKNAILFSNSSTAELNPASIIGGCTLSAVPAQGTTNASNFYFQNIPDPGKIQTDSDGKIQSWRTFGGAALPQSVAVKPGFALASPMLLLREGAREITLQLIFTEAAGVQLLRDVNYYLSTQSAWLKVKGVVSPPDTDTPANQVTVVIELDAGIPPIEPFAVNPDGLSSSWPMLKIEFDSLSNPSSPPVLKSITVTVTVSGVKTFQLFNDYGALSTKKPYPPFGPTPLVNSDFVIGSDEMFSKPLASLIIELNWNNLPQDFQVYYQQYNNYKNPPAKPSGWRIFRWLKSIKWIQKLFRITQAQPSAEPFNNTCFRVNFALLQDGYWADLEMIKLAVDDAKPSATPYVVYQDPTNEQAKGTLLFNEKEKKLVDTSVFGYQPGKLAGLPPGIASLPAGSNQMQLQALSYTDASRCGLMRLRLCAPEYGFGSTLYPNVVAYVAMQNAIKITEKDDPSTFLPPAEMPFVPILTAFTATYTATYQYKLDSVAQGGYPGQCFLYSPFKNYVVYDSTAPATNNNYIVGPSPVNSTVSGIPFWHPINYDGYLFLELANLVSANSLSLYFELARSYGNRYTNSQADYYYLSSTGWRPMALQADSTNNFCCSGIVRVNIPGDVACSIPVMPGNNYWLCIAVKSDAAAFAQTIFLKSNGFAVNRIGNFTASDTVVPQLAPAAIVKTENAVPQIAAIIQPFSSFGGKAAESHSAMTQRVSARLKTKDRAVSPEDFSRLLRHQYDDIYYLKPAFEPKSKTTDIHVVKSYDTWTDTGAFLPVISECREEEMNGYLNERTSAFTNIRVSNFDFQYLRIGAVVTVDQAFAGSGMSKTIIAALNIFLSPWIKSDGAQVVIDQEISSTDIDNFLRSIPGVLDVSRITFTTWIKAGQATLSTDKVKQLTDASLLVSTMDHAIQCNVLK